MKRLLTIILSVFMLFSSCLMVGADGASLEASQAENGDLVITANDEDGRKLIEAVYEGYKSEDVDGRIEVNIGKYENGNGYTYLYNGVIKNVNLDDYVRSYITKEGDTLRVAKQTLIDGGFVDGEWSLFVCGNKVAVATTVTMAGLNKAIPNIASSLTLTGKTDSPIEGKSTKVDKTKFVLVDQNNNKIDTNDFDLYWAEGSVMADGNTWYAKTFDETFDISKKYYLTLAYSYVKSTNDDASSIALNYEHQNLVYNTKVFTRDYSERHAYMNIKATAYFTAEFAVGKVEAKQSTTNDLSKEFVEKVSIKNSAAEIQKLVEVTEKEQAAIDTGKNLEVQMVIGSQSNVTNDDVAKVETTVANKGLTAGAIYDISLYKNIEGDAEVTKVTKTNVETVISFPLEERLVNNNSSINREYKVVRIHDGEEPKVIDATYDAATKSITFKTDKFSTYAICYKDSKVETKKDESTSSNNTSSDSKVVTCEQAMNSKNWTWSESKKACVYRVSNTSSK